MNFLYTPKTRRAVIVYSAALFLAAPLVAARYYWVESNLGRYPPVADDILIPIYWFTAGLLLMSPIIWAFIWFCIRRYPGRVPLWAWNSERPLWSVAWTALLLSLLAWNLLSTRWQQLLVVHSLDVVEAFVQAHFMLVLRSVLVMRPLIGVTVLAA
jgi:hypothetical protein